MYRQGDLLIKRLEYFPNIRIVKSWIEGNETILLHGEVTGHSHKLVGDFDLYRDGSNNVFFEVKHDSKVVHDEHGTINLEVGKYALIRQREYAPKEIVYVKD
jgi:uncharacterized protein (UPF0548 family)